MEGPSVLIDFIVNLTQVRRLQPLLEAAQAMPGVSLRARGGLARLRPDAVRWTLEEAA